MLEAVLPLRRVGGMLGDCLQHSQFFKSQITVDSYCLVLFQREIILLGKGNYESELSHCSPYVH